MAYKNPDIVTRIFCHDKFMSVLPTRPPKTARELDSFLSYNNAPKCFLKSSFGWYKLTKDNKLLYVNRVLYTMSFLDWLEVAKNDNFNGNSK